MPLIRILAAITCCLLAAGHGEEIEVVLTSSKAADKADGVATTKLTPSVEEPKSKTEKRDSADQTGAVFAGPSSSKEPPFRPIYPSAGSYFEAATAETQTPIFGPTTVRYTAAEAAPQAFYERKPPALQYSHQGAAPHHRFSFAVPPQVALYQRPAGIKPPIFNYGELEQEPTQPQVQHQHQQQHQQHHSHTKYLQQQQQQHQPQPPQEQPKLQQRIQYIIAIPLSYMRQLQQQQQQQQQLISGSTTSTTSTAAPLASTRHPLVQLLGPLARDHQGLYRPFYQSDAASAPSSSLTPQQQQYLQIPTSVLLAAAQQLQQHHHQQHQQQTAAYAKASSAQPPAPPPAASYQPAQFIYQHAPAPQAQLQLQRIFLQPPHPQTPTIYAEQQPGQLYAYPLQQQQQQQQHQQQQHHLKQSQQQQQHKYTPAAPTAATTSTTSSTAAAAAAKATATSEAAAAATATRQQHLPVVHYNPVYVQAPAEHQQQQQQQQHQFSILPRFSNNNPKGYESVGPAPAPAPVPIHVVRLSPMVNGPPIHHYHHYQPASLLQPFQYHHAVPQQQQQQQHQQYLSPYAEDGPKPGSPSGSGTILAGPTPVPGMTAASPAIIPYFSHPGAVHYGTHLYHPGAATALGASSAGVSPGVAASSPKQQSTATSGGQLPGGSNNIVKYP